MNASDRIPAEFVKGYELTEEEKSAALNVDVRKLYILGVHSLLLRPFTLSHKVSNEDYAKALAGFGVNYAHRFCLRREPCSGHNRMD